MSHQSDIETAFRRKECSTCRHCYMVGFDFFCEEKGDKQISALATESCYEEDTEMKERINLFSKGVLIQCLQKKNTQSQKNKSKN